MNLLFISPALPNWGSPRLYNQEYFFLAQVGFKLAPCNYHLLGPDNMQTPKWQTLIREKRDRVLKEIGVDRREARYAGLHIHTCFLPDHTHTLVRQLSVRRLSEDFVCQDGYRCSPLRCLTIYGLTLRCRAIRCPSLEGGNFTREYVVPFWQETFPSSCRAKLSREMSDRVTGRI
jgi:hypothetical protein